jgi:putative 4-mercaptohistidine N1-methyltranferase
MAEAPIYETQRLLDEYLLFHYGRAEQIMPWAFGPHEALEFPVRTVRQLLDESLLSANTRALDLGCAVGRSSFELAQYAHDVLGIDYSHSFIRAACEMKTHGSMPYAAVQEGALRQQWLAEVPTHLPRERVNFEQGDAMNLRTDLGSFHIVHAANLLCRLPEPERLLKRLPTLVAPGGQLLITTPCTWLAEFTPPQNWPAGTTRDWLKQALSQHFTLADDQDLPFVIREHQRKFQWTVAWGTRWVRKA